MIFSRFITAGFLIFVLANITEAKRNVIIMIADGQGFNCVKAANMYKGTYSAAKPFDMAGIDWDQRLAVRTNSADSPLGYDPAAMWVDFNWSKKGATDSAAAASAMFSGHKVHNGKLNISPDGQRLLTMFEEAAAAGYATGVVTSVWISHATPAAAVAHGASRYSYSDIANEMIYESKLNVIMGAGHPLYDDDGEKSRAKCDLVGGVKTWNDITDGNGANGFKFIDAREDFEAAAEGIIRGLKYIGIAKVHQTLQEGRKGDVQIVNTATYNRNVPSLATMSLAAINVLAQDQDGFVMMIEGGAVDWANHSNYKGRMIEEEMAFMDAVSAVAKWIEKHGGWSQTLLVVTADHETGQLYGPLKGQFNEIVDAGAGQIPQMCYNSSGHTNAVTPFYAKGMGVARLDAKVIGADTVRGNYIDNTSIHDLSCAVLDLGEQKVAARGNVAGKTLKNKLSDVP